MSKFTARMEKNIVPLANKIIGSLYLQAMQSALSALMPFVILGIIFLILLSPPVNYHTLNKGFLYHFFYGWQTAADFLTPPFARLSSLAVLLLSLLTAGLMGFYLARQTKQNVVTVTILTTLSFVISLNRHNDLIASLTGMDGSNLFGSILLSCLSFEFYHLLVRKNIGGINLEKRGIPKAFTDSLQNLLQLGLVLCTTSVVCYFLLHTTGKTIPDITLLVISPFVNFMDSAVGVFLLSFFVMFFWWFGIHDTLITIPLSPLLLYTFFVNFTAFMQGTPATELPYIVTEPFWWAFLAIGGSGATYSLGLIALFSKSKQLRAIGRASFTASHFNVNETLTFGLPLMYNTSLMVPFLLVMPLNGVLTFLAMSSGHLARTFAYTGWTIFAPLAALTSTLSIKALLFVLCLMLLDFVLYFPFFKHYEKKYMQENERPSM